MSEIREADVLVGGLGAVGASIVRGLDRLGCSVIGIDRYRPPHEMGSSHGLARITREFVGEGAEYVPLVRRSHEIWDELERRGARLRERTGLLYLSRRDGAAPRHHAADFLEATRTVARAGFKPGAVASTVSVPAPASARTSAWASPMRCSMPFE